MDFEIIQSSSHLMDPDKNSQTHTNQAHQNDCQIPFCHKKVRQIHQHLCQCRKFIQLIEQRLKLWQNKCHDQNNNRHTHHQKNHRIRHR